MAVFNTRSSRYFILESSQHCSQCKAGATTSERLLTTSLDAMIKMQSLAYPVFNAFHIGLEAVTKKI